MPSKVQETTSILPSSSVTTQRSGRVEAPVTYLAEGATFERADAGQVPF